jgi:hypothetical protein
VNFEPPNSFISELFLVRKMKSRKYFFILLLVFILIPSNALCESRKVTIVQPESNTTLRNPIKICMEVEGLILEPAANGLREGFGHHHILFSSLPADLSVPIGKNAAIHMVDGAKCKTVSLVPGQYVIQTLFSYADHVPYKPIITDKVLITVK